MNRTDVRHRRTVMKNIVGLLVVAVIAACAAPAAGIETVRSDIRFDVTSVPPGDLANVVAGDTEFALDLLRLAADGRNVFLSPLSITTALGMAEAGARGVTRDEMAVVLHESLADEALHPARGALLARVNEVEPLPSDAEGEPLTLRAVNVLWLQSGYPVLPSYLDVLSASYDAPARLVDFVGDTEASRAAINRWVSEQTEERIEEMIPQGAVTDLTRLVLTNAVYFLGSWVEPFRPDDTMDEMFNLAVGGSVLAPFMHTSGEFTYVQVDGFEAVRLPYWGGASMMLILPHGSPQELLASLDAGSLTAARSEARVVPFVDLAVPSFEFAADLELAPLLKQLGMTTAFAPPSGDGGADFTGMTVGRELFVSEVLHKAFVSVDEAGTEAAAATAVIVGTTSAPVEEPIVLRFDRPFVFLVQHDATGAILFAGVLEDPSARD
jgi:serpin B